MYNKIVNLLAGMALIFIGFHFIIKGWDNVHGFPVPTSTGILFLLFGVVWLLRLFFSKKNKR